MSDKLQKSSTEIAPVDSKEIERAIDSDRPDLLAIAESLRKCTHPFTVEALNPVLTFEGERKIEGPLGQMMPAPLSERVSGSVSRNLPPGQYTGEVLDVSLNTDGKMTMRVSMGDAGIIEIPFTTSKRPTLADMAEAMSRPVKLIEPGSEPDFGPDWDDDDSGRGPK